MDNNIYLNFTDEQIDDLLFNCDLDKLNEKKDKQTDENTPVVCISCKSDKLVIDNTKGYLVCQDCAVINKEFLDKNVEFSNGGTSSYGCPSNYFFPKSALGTKISSKNYNRLAIIQGQGQMPYIEKSLLEVVTSIQERCKKYNITQTIIDSAKILYKKVADFKHTKGKRKGKRMIMRCVNRVSMLAACLFYACQIQKEPRTPKEIGDIYNLDVRNVNRGCRKFNDYIDISTIFVEIKSSQSSDFIERFAKKLNIDKQYINIAKDVSSNIHKIGLATTHEPPSVAAGCILLVASMYHVDINKKQISDIFGISDVTISKTYRKIFPYHKIIMNNKMTDLIIERKNNIKKQPIIMTEETLISSERSVTELSDDDESEESDDDDVDLVI